jgi:hypothetical protein
MNLKLQFGAVFVGEIEGAFWSDDTGYGVFHPASDTGDGPVLRRIRDYIAFSEEWHRRLAAEQAPDSTEWNAFRDVYDSPLWHTATPAGVITRIEGPVFIEGEVTWKPA